MITFLQVLVLSIHKQTFPAFHPHILLMTFLKYLRLVWFEKIPHFWGLIIVSTGSPVIRVRSLTLPVWQPS
jgi:hypothetical protein